MNGRRILSMRLEIVGVCSAHARGGGTLFLTDDVRTQYCRNVCINPLPAAKKCFKYFSQISHSCRFRLNNELGFGRFCNFALVYQLRTIILGSVYRPAAGSAVSIHIFMKYAVFLLKRPGAVLRISFV